MHIVYNAHFEHKLILVQVISTPIPLFVLSFWLNGASLPHVSVCVCVQKILLFGPKQFESKLYTKISLTLYRMWTLLLCRIEDIVGCIVLVYTLALNLRWWQRRRWLMYSNRKRKHIHTHEMANENVHEMHRNTYHINSECARRSFNSMYTLQIAFTYTIFI